MSDRLRELREFYESDASAEVYANIRRDIILILIDTLEEAEAALKTTDDAIAYARSYAGSNCPVVMAAISRNNSALAKIRALREGGEDE